MGGITSYCGFINRVDIFKLATINSFKSWMIFQVFGIEQGPIYGISSVQFFFFTSLTTFSLSHTRDKTKNIFLNYFYYCLMTLSNSKKKYPSFNSKYSNHESQLAECHCLVKWNNYLKVRVKNFILTIRHICSTIIFTITYCNQNYKEH